MGGILSGPSGACLWQVCQDCHGDMAAQSMAQAVVLKDGHRKCAGLPVSVLKGPLVSSAGHYNCWEVQLANWMYFKNPWQKLKLWIPKEDINSSSSKLKEAWVGHWPANNSFFFYGTVGRGDKILCFCHLSHTAYSLGAESPTSGTLNYFVMRRRGVHSGSRTSEDSLVPCPLRKCVQTTFGKLLLGKG